MQIIPRIFSHSETEEPAENATAQPFTLIDISSSDDHFTDKMEDLSNAENVNLQNKDSCALDHNSGIKDLEVEMISADLDLSFQRGSFDEEDVQEYLPNDRNTEEYAKNKEDAGALSDLNDQADYISDSSSDDHSTSEEETHFLPSLKQEEEKSHITQHNSTQDMVRVDNDIDYTCPDTENGDVNSPEQQYEGHLSFCDVKERSFTNTSSISYYEESNTESTELHQSTESDKTDTAIKDHDKSSSESSDKVGDTKNIINEVLWSSSLLMDEDNLRLDEYDWGLTVEDSFKINSGEGENQEYTEEDLEKSDDNKNRIWELEKTRIEAFYRFYGDQADPEDTVGKCYREHTSVLHGCLSNIDKIVNGLQVSEAFLLLLLSLGRNHKVTFRLEKYDESSEYDDESDR